jgi:hypothetical protein
MLAHHHLVYDRISFPSHSVILCQLSAREFDRVLRQGASRYEWADEDYVCISIVNLLTVLTH